MVQVVKSEWHQVEKRYSANIDEAILAEIYPDLSEDEIKEMMTGLLNGKVDIDWVIEAATEAGVDIDWNWLDEDDWWTDRKGGYDVTYEVQDDSQDN
jgi:hypothetical protein